VIDDSKDKLIRNLNTWNDGTDTTTTTTTTTTVYGPLSETTRGWAGTRRNIHPPTILIIIQSLSASSIYHDPQHPPCSNYVLGNLFAQPLSKSFLIYLLVCTTSYSIHFFTQSMSLFATHAHTSAACLAIVPKPESPERGLRSSPPACTASLVVGSSNGPWPWPWIGSRSRQHTQYV